MYDCSWSLTLFIEKLISKQVKAKNSAAANGIILEDDPSSSSSSEDERGNNSIIDEDQNDIMAEDDEEYEDINNINRDDLMTESTITPQQLTSKGLSA